MASLAELTDNPFVQNTIDSVALRDATDLPKTRIIVRPQNTPDNEPVKQDDSKLQNIIDQLFGLNGKERYQLWPEKLVRDAISAPHDVMTGEIPQYVIDPVTGEAQTSPQMIKAGVDTSSLAGSGGLAGAGSEAGVALGSAPFLRPALKYGEKLYKGKPGQQHMDVIPADLYPTFQKQAMSGEDISNFNFGFLNHKGQFLSREDALKYAIDNGLVDPHSAQYGALTSTLMSDSAKPGTAINALAKTNSPEFKSWFKDSKVVDADGNPLVVYHGTNAEFKNFDNKKTGKNDLGLWGRGHYFASSPETANSYALRQGEGAKVIPAYVSLSNPLILKTGKDLITRLPDGTNTRTLVGPNLDGSKIKEIATLAGNDGVIQLKPDGTIGDIVAFKPEQIKSAIGNSGKFDPKNSNILMSDTSKPGAALAAVANTNKPFYSAVENAIAAAKQPKADAQQWISFLKNQPGVKQEELAHLGLDKLQGSITKDDLLKAVQEGQPQIKEVVKGGKPDTSNWIVKEGETGWGVYDETGKFIGNAVKRRARTPEEAISEVISNNPNTKYHSYQLPGGENYREMLLTLPHGESTQTYQQLAKQYKELSNVPLGQKLKDGRTVQQTLDDITQKQQALKYDEGYHSSHWDEPNVLAHIRMNDRTIDGKKTLHIEEIQSDWHQAGRKQGYKSENPVPMEQWMKDKGYVKENMTPLEASQQFSDARYKEYQKETGYGSSIPDAPFKKTWDELALKKAITEAVKNGYDQISWTPGEAQAARYDLSKQVDKIAIPMVNENGTRSVRVDAKGGSPFKLMVNKDGIVEGHGGSSSQFSGKPLSDIVGKEMADKIMKLEKPDEFSGDGLKIGGQGMKAFYDKMLVDKMNALTKKYGGKVEQKDLNAAPTYEIKNPILNKDGKEIVSVYKNGTFLADMEKSEASHYIDSRKSKDAPVKAHVLKITPELREQVLKKGLPLFSAGVPVFTPVDHDPFESK